MAVVRALFQGLERDNDHDSAVNELLRRPDIDEFLFSIAFVRRSGVARIAENLQTVADRVTLFLGVRNGVTSVQSIFALLDIGIAPYIVDTASTSKIFHPKVYAAFAGTEASVILGSANLTFSGLNQNIEASSIITLDCDLEQDKDYVDKLKDIFHALPGKYPDHVFQINNRRQAVRLYQEGRLEDERITRMPTATRTGGGRKRDELQPMPIFVGRRQKPNQVRPKSVRRHIRSAGRTSTGVLMWESKPLTERSLNIPKAANTNITGDTNLGQGLMHGIDFQTYFRNDVFAGLTWATVSSSANPHLERAHIDAEIIIKGVSYGVFELEVTHDPRKNTPSFRQRNVMTKIKWGPARQLIAKRDLLGRTLRLYKKSDTDFTIVID